MVVSIPKLLVFHGPVFIVDTQADQSIAVFWHLKDSDNSIIIIIIIIIIILFKFGNFNIAIYIKC